MRRLVDDRSPDAKAVPMVEPTTEPDEYRRLVNEDIRGGRDEKDMSLRHPDHVARWRITLIQIKISIEAQLSARGDDEYWRVGALRFKSGVEARISEANILVREKHASKQARDRAKREVRREDLVKELRSDLAVLGRLVSWAGSLVPQGTAEGERWHQAFRDRASDRLDAYQDHTPTNEPPGDDQ